MNIHLHLVLYELGVGPLQALGHLFYSCIIQGVATHQDHTCLPRCMLCTESENLVPIRLHLKEAAVVEQDPLLRLISSQTLSYLTQTCVQHLF